MAIYHLSVKAHSRAHGVRGTSALALAAYRTGERLVDPLTGEIYDYRRRKGVVHAELCHPEHVVADARHGRQEAWARMEHRIRRRDGVVAREVEVALPHELAPERAVEVARALARELAARYRTTVDLGVHAPVGRGRRAVAGDVRNVHAHLLIAPYVLDQNGMPSERMTALDPAPQFGGRAEVRRLRSLWEDRCNTVLERVGCPERVDHRSLRDQGIDRVPQTKRGRAATYVARRAAVRDEHDRNRSSSDRAPAPTRRADERSPFLGPRTVTPTLRLPDVDRAAGRELALFAREVLGAPVHGREIGTHDLARNDSRPTGPASRGDMSR